MIYFQSSIYRRNLFSHQNSNLLVLTWLPNQPITAAVKRTKPFKSSSWKQCSYVSDFCKSIWNCKLKKGNSEEYALNSFPNISVLVKNGVFTAPPHISSISGPLILAKAVFLFYGSDQLRHDSWNVCETTSCYGQMNYGEDEYSYLQSGSF